MSSLLLTDDNDLDISSNSFSVIDGADYIKQSLKTKLQLFKGESFLDLDKGIPYFQEILKKQADLSRVETIFKQEIINTDGVVELLEFSLDYANSTRTLSIEFTVKTEDGIIELSEELL